MDTKDILKIHSVASKLLREYPHRFIGIQPSKNFALVEAEFPSSHGRTTLTLSVLRGKNFEREIALRAGDLFYQATIETRDPNKRGHRLSISDNHCDVNIGSKDALNMLRKVEPETLQPSADWKSDTIHQREIRSNQDNEGNAMGDLVKVFIG